MILNDGSIFRHSGTSIIISLACKSQLHCGLPFRGLVTDFCGESFVAKGQTYFRRCSAVHGTWTLPKSTLEMVPVPSHCYLKPYRHSDKTIKSMQFATAAHIQVSKHLQSSFQLERNFLPSKKELQQSRQDEASLYIYEPDIGGIDRDKVDA